MKRLLLFFCLLHSNLNFAQIENSKNEIFNLCLRLAELQKENHLIGNHYQLIVKSNNLFSETDQLECFGKPVILFGINKKINTNHLVFDSFTILNDNCVVVKFYYQTKESIIWYYEIEFVKEDNWRIKSNKANLKNNR